MDSLKTEEKLQLCDLFQSEYYPGASRETGCNWSHCSFNDYFLWVHTAEGKARRINWIYWFFTKTRARLVFPGCTHTSHVGWTHFSQFDISGQRHLSSSDFFPLLLEEEWGVRKTVYKDEGRELLLLQGWYIDHLDWKRPLRSLSPIICIMSEVRPHFTWTWCRFTPYQHHSLHPGQKTQGNPGQQTLLFPPHLLRHHRLYLIYPWWKGNRGLHTFCSLSN